MAESATSVSRSSSSTYRSWCLVIRLKCLIVAYIHLFAVIIDIIAHVVVVGILTDGFQCDVTATTISNVDWYRLEPILLAVNIGTHGFHPIPLIISEGRRFAGVPDRGLCYPAIFHVYISDVLSLMINILWLYLVIKFVKAVREKDPETILFFVGVGVCKLIIAVLTLSYLPEFRSIHNPDTITFLKLLDIAISGLCLTIIYEYMKVIKAEKKRENEAKIEKDVEPPSYPECLVDSPPVSEDKADTETVVDIQPEPTSLRNKTNVGFKHKGGVEPPSYPECVVNSPPVSEDKADTETVVDTQPEPTSLRNNTDVDFKHKGGVEPPSYVGCLVSSPPDSEEIIEVDIQPEVTSET